MAVKIRLKKTGRRHVNSFRVVVCDARKTRDGRVLERVGTYLPEQSEEAGQLTVNAERITYWLGVGAQPTETVAALLRRAGIGLPKKTVKAGKTESTDESESN